MFHGFQTQISLSKQAWFLPGWSLSEAFIFWHNSRFLRKMLLFSSYQSLDSPEKRNKHVITTAFFFKLTFLRDYRFNFFRKGLIGCFYFVASSLFEEGLFLFSASESSQSRKTLKCYKQTFSKNKITLLRNYRFHSFHKRLSKQMSM